MVSSCSSREGFAVDSALRPRTHSNRVRSITLVISFCVMVYYTRDYWILGALNWNSIKATNLPELHVHRLAELLNVYTVQCIHYY